MCVSCIKIIAPISGHPRTLICGHDWASMEFVYACVASFKMGLGGLNYFCFFVQATLSRDRLVGFVAYPPCMVVLPTSCIANILFTNIWSHFANMLGQSPHFFCLISGSKSKVYTWISHFFVSWLKNEECAAQIKTLANGMMAKQLTGQSIELKFPRNKCIIYFPTVWRLHGDYTKKNNASRKYMLLQLQVVASNSKYS